MTVNPVNDAPVANPNTAITNEDTPLANINVLGNDTDVDGDTLTVTAATVPAAQGSVTINPDGTLNFTPAANYNGTAVISYTISDGKGGTASSTLTVTVNPVNDAPVANPNTAITNEDTPLANINVLGNDTDVDGDTLTVTAATVPAAQADKFRRGRGRPVKPVKKVNQTLRLDPDVLDAFRQAGAGWQSRINQILRDNMPKSPA